MPKSGPQSKSFLQPTIHLGNMDPFTSLDHWGLLVLGFWTHCTSSDYNIIWNHNMNNRALMSWRIWIIWNLLSLFLSYPLFWEVTKDVAPLTRKRCGVSFVVFEHNCSMSEFKNSIWNCLCWITLYNWTFSLQTIFIIFTISWRYTSLNSFSLLNNKSL